MGISPGIITILEPGDYAQRPMQLVRAVVDEAAKLIADAKAQPNAPVRPERLANLEALVRAYQLAADGAPSG